jgi:hypothetical protein
MSGDGEKFTIKVVGVAVNAGQRKVKSPPKVSYNLTMKPSTPVAELKRDICQLFYIPTNKIQSYQLSLSSGSSHNQLDQEGKKTVRDLGISGGVVYHVEFSLLDSQAMKVPTRPRSTRKAAEIATKNLPGAVAAQNEIIKQHKQQEKKKNKKKAAAHKKRQAATKAKVKMGGEGYRLSDGKSTTTSNSAAKKPPLLQVVSNKDETAEALLGLVGESGGVNKHTRDFLRREVDKRYDENHNQARVAAVESGRFKFEEVKGGTVVEGGGVVLGVAKDYEMKGDEKSTRKENGGKFIVTYPNDIGGRAYHSEQVEIYPPDVANNAMTALVLTRWSMGMEHFAGNLYAGEDKRLQPSDLASYVNIFWSFVYYNCTSNGNKLSVVSMIQKILPREAIDYLRRGGRKQNLSEIAMENLEQGIIPSSLSEIAKKDLEQSNIYD